MSELTIDGHRIGVLFSEAEIAERVKAIATDIAARKPTNLLVVPILKGSFVFAADLIRELQAQFPDIKMPRHCRWHRWERSTISTMRC